MESLELRCRLWRAILQRVRCALYELNRAGLYRTLVFCPLVPFFFAVPFLSPLVIVLYWKPALPCCLSFVFSFPSIYKCTIVSGQHHTLQRDVSKIDCCLSGSNQAGCSIVAFMVIEAKLERDTSYHLNARHNPKFNSPKPAIISQCYLDLQRKQHYNYAKSQNKGRRNLRSCN